MTKKFGLSVALTTPFDDKGNILLPLMTDHASHCLANGCDSVTVFGTTGEGSSIGQAEREMVFMAFASAGLASDRLVAGVLVNASADATEQCIQALHAGVRTILLAPPSYFKNVSDDGLFEWFSSVFWHMEPRANNILLYNIPSMTMTKISVELVTRLRQTFPGVVKGVKDSSGDWPYTEQLLKKHGDLTILIGDERHLAAGIRRGGEGAISGIANFLPKEIRSMAVDGRENKRVTDLVECLLKYPVTPAVKALVARASGKAVWLNVKPPLVTMPRQDREAIEQAFHRAFLPQMDG